MKRKFILVFVFILSLGFVSVDNQSVTNQVNAKVQWTKWYKYTTWANGKMKYRADRTMSRKGKWLTQTKKWYNKQGKLIKKIEEKNFVKIKGKYKATTSTLKKYNKKAKLTSKVITTYNKKMKKQKQVVYKYNNGKLINKYTK